MKRSISRRPPAHEDSVRPWDSGSPPASSSGTLGGQVGREGMGAAGKRRVDPQSRRRRVSSHRDHGPEHAISAESRWQTVGRRGVARHRMAQSPASHGRSPSCHRGSASGTAQGSSNLKIEDGQPVDNRALRRNALGSTDGHKRRHGRISPHRGARLAQRVHRSRRPRAVRIGRNAGGAADRPRARARRPRFHSARDSRPLRPQRGDARRRVGPGAGPEPSRGDGRAGARRAGSSAPRLSAARRASCNAPRRASRRPQSPPLGPSPLSRTEPGVLAVAGGNRPGRSHRPRGDRHGRRRSDRGAEID